MAAGDGQKADGLSALQQHLKTLRTERRRLQNQLASVTATLGRTENAMAALLAHADTTFVGEVVDSAVADDGPKENPTA